MGRSRAEHAGCCVIGLVVAKNWCLQIHSCSVLLVEPLDNDLLLDCPFQGDNLDLEHCHHAHLRAHLKNCQGTQWNLEDQSKNELVPSSNLE